MTALSRDLELLNPENPRPVLRNCPGFPDGLGHIRDTSSHAHLRAFTLRTRKPAGHSAVHHPTSAHMHFEAESRLQAGSPSTAGQGLTRGRCDTRLTQRLSVILRRLDPDEPDSPNRPGVLPHPLTVPTCDLGRSSRGTGIEPLRAREGGVVRRNEHGRTRLTLGRSDPGGAEHCPHDAQGQEHRESSKFGCRARCSLCFQSKCGRRRALERDQRRVPGASRSRVDGGLAPRARLRPGPFRASGSRRSRQKSGDPLRTGYGDPVEIAIRAVETELRRHGCQLERSDDPPAFEVLARWTWPPLT